jgi:taurine transport system permease protein
MTAPISDLSTVAGVEPAAAPPAGPAGPGAEGRPLDEVRQSPLDSPLVVWAIRLGVFAALIGVWEYYGNQVSQALFAPPSAIAESFRELYVEENEMLPAIWTSFGALFAGYGIAVVLGVVTGVAMGRNRTFESLVSPYLTFIFSIPYIALIPLLVTWVGIEWSLRVVLVMLASFFPVVVNTLVGVKEVDEDLLDVARVNCATERQVLRTVVLPASIPFIFTGMQVALGLALVGVVVAEMTAAVTGLGGLIITYSNFFQTADLFVPIITLMVLSVGLTRLMSFLERKLMPWNNPAR